MFVFQGLGLDIVETVTPAQLALTDQHAPLYTSPHLPTLGPYPPEPVLTMYPSKCLFLPLETGTRGNKVHTDLKESRIELSAWFWPIIPVKRNSFGGMVDNETETTSEIASKSQIRVEGAQKK